MNTVVVTVKAAANAQLIVVTKVVAVVVMAVVVDAPIKWRLKVEVVYGSGKLAPILAM